VHPDLEPVFVYIFVVCSWCNNILFVLATGDLSVKHGLKIKTYILTINCIKEFL
jgi:hypothetical protein